jgi:CRISPR-associated protein (TIGR03984 family)
MSNGLNLKRILSESNPVSVSENILSFVKKNIKENSFVVAYLDNEVLIGKYEDGNFILPDNKTIDPKFIQKLRIFNENCELLVWRSRQTLKSRFRKDGKGEKVFVIEANQVLFGTQKDDNFSQDGFVSYIEDRGTGVILPDIGLISDSAKGKRIGIKTRNYVSYTENWQATYDDVRFVGFVQLKEEVK